MPRDYKQHIDYIIEAISSIREYVKGTDYSYSATDRKTWDAVVRNLEIIGEAAKALPDEIKNKAPQIEWAKIVALQTILTTVLRNFSTPKYSGYSGIFLKSTWINIDNKLKEIETSCRNLL